jgi:hypothetical protein
MFNSYVDVTANGTGVYEVGVFYVTSVSPLFQSGLKICC